MVVDVGAVVMGASFAVAVVVDDNVADGRRSNSRIAVADCSCSWVRHRSACAVATAADYILAGTFRFVVAAQTVALAREWSFQEDCL